jgi:lysophospholipase L1-like esterase
MIGGFCIPVLIEGDSITAGTGAAAGQGYAQQYVSNKNAAYACKNISVAGSHVSDLVLRAARADSYSRAPKTLLACLIGVNDFIGGITNTTTFLANYANYLDARRLVFGKVVVCTILPSTSPDVGGVSFSSWRSTVNATIRTWPGSHCDAVADFAADATMGPDAAAADTLLYGDGTHPTTLGHTTLEPIYRALLNAIYP